MTTLFSRTIQLLIILLIAAPYGASAQSHTRGSLRGWLGGALSQQINALGPVAPTTFPIPILYGVSVGDLSPNFGDPRDGGSRSHKGEDIMATKGMPIVSPVSGVILRTTTGESEGNTVYEAIAGGYTLVYMHLDRFAEGVTSGTVVQPGSLIGYVGNTGNASGGAAHLHLEVHDASGSAVDPMPFLTQEFTADQKSAFLAAIMTQTADPSGLASLTGVRAASTHATVSVAPGSLPLLRDLSIGMTGEDVRALQVFLNARGFTVALQGAGSPGNETSYFGPATRAAVARFQSSRSVSPAVGYVGPLTRAALSLVS